MLFNTDIQFHKYPPSVKASIMCLVSGWALHLCYYYYLFVHKPGAELARVDYLMVGVGVAICFFVAAINKWARMLCVFFNLAIVFMYLALTLLQQANFSQRLFTAAVAGLFGLATYYLLKKETAAYFSSYNQPPEQDEPEGTQGS